ncbi:cytochrome P450 [Acephala macrosclerotiorum]|nr:cytochrome P450 [Acephala macrosclerotiorum]
MASCRDFHLVLDAELRQKYGDFVRTGPRELSIIDPQAIPLILGFSSKTFKGPFYDSMEDSVSTARDEVFHKQRRKVWDSSMKQLPTTYSPQLEEFTDTLLKRIKSNLGKAITINELAIHYNYDVITQLAYSQSGGFVDGSSSQTTNKVLSGIQNGIGVIGLLNQVLWMMILLTTFAGLGGPMKVFNDWSNQVLEDRKKREMKALDLMEQLLQNTKLDRRGNSLLFAESRVIIGAGSDTTATALPEIFIFLAHHPEYVQKIREEMDPIFATSKYSCQVAYLVLESVINETLRLYHPVLFGSQRVTPPQGLQIGDKWVPGDMVVYMPSWQLRHDARNFVDTDEFVPERWTTKPEMILNKSAFLPFLIGPNNCPGKSLAMMELPSVIERTLNEFDIAFPAELKFDEVKFFRNVKDHFVAGVLGNHRLENGDREMNTLLLHSFPLPSLHRWEPSAALILVPSPPANAKK